MEKDWNFTSIQKCVLELVLNALSAEATAIAVRIDTRNQKVQAVDNGFGIAKKNLRDIGEYPVKEHNKATPLNAMDTFICGRSLVNIRQIASALIITSRCNVSAETYGKFFSANQASKLMPIENRPTRGTTVTVYASREFCNWNSNLDSFAIRCIIVYLAMVNTQVSFSVRDDARDSILLRIGKNQKRVELLKVICGQSMISKQIHSVKIRIFNKVKIVGFWGYECTRSRKIQQILLNLRPVRCLQLENFIIRTVSKIYYSHVENESVNLEKIFFLLYIASPDSEYSLSMMNGQFTVEFHQIDRIGHSIEKCMRIIRSRKSNFASIFTYRPILPPLIYRPIGRSLGLKLKKTFLTNVAKHTFEKEKIRCTEGPRVKAVINHNDCCSDVTKNRIEDISNSEAFIPVKKFQNDNNDMSSSSEKYNVKSLSNIARPISQRGSSDAILSVKVNECDNPDASRMSGKLQDTVEPRQVSQRIEDSSVKEYQYDNHGVLWISQKCVEKSSIAVEEMFTISDCSQWSDWIYEPGTRNLNAAQQHPETAHPTIVKRFRFLPLKLHALLQFGDAKFISRSSLENEALFQEKFYPNFNYRRQDLDVRPCTRRSFEVRLKLESLQCMKVLNQVNREFIVALTMQDDKKLLVIIDQHAMDERIRYENLLRGIRFLYHLPTVPATICSDLPKYSSAYRRDQKNQRFTFVTLNRPIIISDLSPITCNLLAANERLLLRYGLSLAFRNENTFQIFTVPRCFSKKTYRADNTDIEHVVRKLLQEILDNLNSNGIAKFLPFTIHDAIASEACHGAIKFGDSLTVKQCKSLVSCWKQTEAPNRCAHGRPSVIPLLELLSFKRSYRRLASQDKLNFASLRNLRRIRGTMCTGTARYHPRVKRSIQGFEEL